MTARSREELRMRVLSCMTCMAMVNGVHACSRTCHASCHGDGLSRRCLGTGACATVSCEQALYAGASALPQTSKWALENEGKRARRNHVGKLT
jgi:hypothetical protein